MQHEIFKLVLRRSEKQVYFPRQGCKNTGDISICEIGDEKLIIPGKYFYRMSCEESAIFFPILAYRIVTSTNTCYYSENQVFGGVTV